MAAATETTTEKGPRRAGEPVSARLVDIRALLDVGRRRARLILSIAGALMLLVVTGLALATPRFTATSVLIVDPRTPRVLPSEAVLSGIGQDAAAVESQVEVVQSSAVARAVIAELKLDSDPEFTRQSLLGGATAIVRDLLGRPKPLSEAEAADRILARFADNLRVARRGLTYVLEVRFTSESPEKAARIANAVSAAYVADQSATKNAATREVAGWLNERLDELRRKVAEAERAVATYKSENGIVDAGEGRTLGDRQVSELNQQLILARARAAEAKARLDQVQKATAASVGAGAIPEALLSPVIANLRSQYAEAARREAETQTTYGPKHPASSAMKAQMADVRAQIEREIGRVTAGIRNEYEVAQSRERSLERSLSELKSQSATTGQAAVKLRELEREAQASRTLLEQSLLRFRETSEQDGLQRPDARVLSPATPPLKPSEPKTTLVLFAGLVGSLVAGLGAAAFAESLGRGYRSTREVEASLALPVLANLPVIETGGAGRRASRPVREASVAKPATLAPASRKLGRFAVEQPLTPFGEAIRAVRARISEGAGGSSRVLAITSALPNEGKSTVALNLAHSFAKSGVSTLFIDADVRKAGAGQQRGWGGLVQMLATRGSVDPPVEVDLASRLHILGPGSIEDVAAASELLTGSALRDFVERLRRRYKMIVIDTPPLLPFADGRGIIQSVDLGLFVVEWNRTDAEAAGAALESLGPHAAKIAGVLLNKVDLRAQRLHDYGHDYGQDYRVAS